MSSITNIMTHTSALNGSGEGKISVLRLNTETNQIPSNSHIQSLMQHIFFGETNHKYVATPLWIREVLRRVRVRVWSISSPLMGRSVCFLPNTWVGQPLACECFETVEMIFAIISKWRKGTKYYLWRKWVTLDWLRVYILIYMATPCGGDLWKLSPMLLSLLGKFILNRLSDYFRVELVQ